MFGPRLNTVFASRWNALLWAAGILLTAYCSVPKADQDAPKAKPAAQPAEKHKQTDPWALSTAHPAQR